MLAALRVMFTRSKKEMEGKTATELGRYKVCKNEETAAVSPRITYRKVVGLSKFDLTTPCSLKQQEPAATGPQQAHMFAIFQSNVAKGRRSDLFSRQFLRAGRPFVHQCNFFGGKPVVLFLERGLGKA